MQGHKLKKETTLHFVPVVIEFTAELSLYGRAQHL